MSFLIVIFSFFYTICISYSIVYDGACEFPAFHKNINNKNMLTPFINYIHPNVSSKNGKLYNNGSTIPIGTILSVSYPILTHFKNKTNDLIDQIIDIYSNKIQYKSIISYLQNQISINNIDKSKDKNLISLITNEFGNDSKEYYLTKKKTAKLSNKVIDNILLYFIQSSKPNQPSLQAIYQYFNEMQINETHNNAISFINEFDSSNIFTITNPVITYSNNFIPQNTFIRHKIMITKDPPFSEKLKKARLISNLVLDASNNNNTNHIKKLMHKLVSPEYLTTLETHKIILIKGVMEMASMSQIFHLLRDIPTLIPYFGFLVKNYEDNFIGFGNLLVDTLNIEKASIYYTFITQYTASLQHWKIGIKKLYFKDERLELLKLVRESMEVSATINQFIIRMDNLDIDLVYFLCGTYYAYGNRDENIANNLFSKEYKKWITNKNYYKILMEINKIHQKFLRLSIKNRLFSIMARFQCLITLIKLDYKIDESLELFVDFIWNLDWNNFELGDHLNECWKKEDNKIQERILKKLLTLGERTYDTKYFIIYELLSNPLLFTKEYNNALNDKPINDIFHALSVFHQQNNHTIANLYFLLNSITYTQYKYGKNNMTLLFNDTNYVADAIKYANIAVIELNDSEIFERLLNTFSPYIRRILFENTATQLNINEIYALDLYANVLSTFGTLDIQQETYKLLENIGMKYMEHNDTLKAVTYFSYSIEQNVTNHGIYLKYIKALNIEKGYKEAIMAFNEIIEPLFDEIYFTNEIMVEIYSEYSFACDQRSTFALSKAIDLII